MNEEISYLALENKSLQSRLADQQQQYSLKIHEVLADLDRARKETVSSPLCAFCSRTGASVPLASQARGGLDSARPSARQAAALRPLSRPSRITNPLLTRLVPPAETPA